jgi:hypothetical protein
VNGEDPPAIASVAVPLQFPKQSIAVEEIFPVIACGSLIVTVIGPNVHPDASTTVKLYVPAHNPEAICVV